MACRSPLRKSILIADVGVTFDKSLFDMRTFDDAQLTIYFTDAIRNIGAAITAIGDTNGDWIADVVISGEIERNDTVVTVEMRSRAVLTSLVGFYSDDEDSVGNFEY